jgi:hypothetical protein
MNVEATTTSRESDLEALWARYGTTPKFGVREKLVILSAIEMADVGILDFNAKNPCAAIGANSSIVNYYFGGREGLMAEAGIFVHDQWINSVRVAVSTKPIDPVKQINLIIQSELAFTKHWKEMAVFGAYPNSSPTLRALYKERFEKRAQDALEYYLAVMTVLIHDARAGKKSLIDFELGNPPKYKMVTHSSAFLAATSLTWSLHGLTIWSAGQHAASQSIEDKRVTSITSQFAVKNHIKHVIASAIKG